METIKRPRLQDIAVHDNVVPRNLYDSLLDTCPALDWQFGWKTRSNPQMQYWHHEVGYGTKENIQDVSAQVNLHPQKIFSIYQTWLQTHLLPAGSKILRFYLNAHTFGTDGWPHVDSDRADEVTAVLYLNQEWRPEWGGETVIFGQDGDISRAVLPRANRLLTFPSQLLHAPRPLCKAFQGLRIVLVVKASLGSSHVADFQPDPAHIELLTRVGSADLAHSGRDLLIHLIGTHQILRQQGAQDAVCLAGLFHSVYGTTFMQCTLPIERAAVRAHIGQQAERLAWLFCMIDRPGCWNAEGLELPLKTAGHVQVTSDELNALRQIEQANLIEQGILDSSRWENIEGCNGAPSYFSK